MEKKIVVANIDAKMFGAVKGRKCVVLKGEFYNGEGHYTLKDVETGEKFNSPDIFWEEIIKN